MIIGLGKVSEPVFVVEQVTDPVACEKLREQHERARRNSAWLQAHWNQLLPQARGKFVAVAAEEAFIAESAKEAWEWAARTHPEDNGALVQYVRTSTGPKIYAHRG